MNKVAAVVLAAGKGKRMKSDLPKVLHPIFGRPMIEVLLDTLISLKINKIVAVIGFKADEVKKALKDYQGKISYAIQAEQLGTGHAVLMAESELKGFVGDILVVAGDVPFLSSETIARLIDTHRKEQAAGTVLSSVPPDPTGYGRIIRKDGTSLVDYIIEHKDASEEQRRVREINTGTFCFDSRHLFDALREIRADNSQKEYYLTDVMAILHRKGLKAAVYKTDNPDEALGINSVDQMAELEVRFAKKSR